MTLEFTPAGFDAFQNNITEVSTVRIGTASSTGTANQALQVGTASTVLGAYISGNLGIGTTNPQYRTHIVGTDDILAVESTNTTARSTLKFITNGNDWEVGARGSASSPADAFYIFSNDYNTYAQVIDSFGNVLLGGSTTSTGTASQPLQVTGGAYVSGNLGIGTTNPNSSLHVRGNTLITGIVTASSFSGNASSATYATSSGISTYATTAGVSSNVIGGIGSITSLSVSGISTFTNGPVLVGSGTPTGTASQPLQVTGGAYVSGNLGIGTTNPRGSLQIGVGITFTVGGNATFAGIVTANSYRGDGSLLTGIIAGVSISTNTTNSNQLIPYATSGYGSTTGFGATTSLVYNPSTSSLGIGTTNPQGQLQIGTGVTIFSSGNASFAGIVTATFKGDGTRLRSVDGQSFNTGISTSITATLTGIGDNILTLPSTTGLEYIIHSILATNIGTGNTEFNVIGAFDFSASERSYFAYNIPIPTGTSVELLKQPQVLNPSDKIVMRSTDVNRIGIDSSIQVYISYESKTDTNYFGVGLGTVGVAVTSLVTVYTSSPFPSLVQSIRLTNRTDSGAYPVSVSILRPGQSILLVDHLIVPKYSSIELLDAQKQLYLNDQIQIQVDQAPTIDIQVSGKQIVP
jgi:hypothetical protein